MYRKHLESLAIVSIKFIFNFDDHLSSHTYYVLLSTIGYVSLMIVAFFAGIADWGHEVQTAATGFLEHISHKGAQKEEQEGLLLHIHNFKNNFLQKDIWQWRMK
jgi:hypothetical protein